MIQAILDIIVKLVPNLRYTLKKGDAYDEEFYQEMIHRLGTYYDSRVGTRLCTFMNRAKKDNQSNPFEILSMDELLKSK